MRVWQKSKYSAFLISEKQGERTDYKGILALISVVDSSYTELKVRVPDQGHGWTSDLQNRKLHTTYSVISWSFRIDQVEPMEFQENRHCILPGAPSACVVLMGPSSAWPIADWRDPWPERVLHKGQECLALFLRWFTF